MDDIKNPSKDPLMNWRTQEEERQHQQEQAKEFDVGPEKLSKKISQHKSREKLLNSVSSKSSALKDWLCTILRLIVLKNKFVAF